MPRRSNNRTLSALRRRLRRAWVMLVLRFMRRVAEGFVRRRPTQAFELLRREDERAPIPVETFGGQLARWERIQHWRNVACAAKVTPSLSVIAVR